MLQEAFKQVAGVARKGVSKILLFISWSIFFALLILIVLGFLSKLNVSVIKISDDLLMELFVLGFLSWLVCVLTAFQLKRSSIEVLER